MISRRRFIMGFVITAPPLGAIASAQEYKAQQAKAQRVGLLGLGSAQRSPFFEALRQGLRERGWVEGQNLADRKSTRLNSSHIQKSRMPSSA